MKPFINSIKENSKFELICTAIKVTIMILAIIVYLLEADLSTAPEFIYNQF